MALRSVFIAESVAPEDYYLRRVDGHAANEILKIRDLRTEYRIVMTQTLLKRAVKEAVDGQYEVFHFSSHGDDDGVGLSDGTSIDWMSFAEILKPFAGTTKVLVMSSCQGGAAALTKALVKKGARFGWVFGSTANIVYFAESCLAWSILYNRLADDGFSRSALKKTLKVINTALDGDFVYRRWDGTQYLRYP